MFILGAGFAMALAVAGLLVLTGRPADRWLAAMAAAAAIATGALGLARADPSELGRASSFLVGPAFMALPVLFHLYVRAMAGTLRMRDHVWFMPVGLYGLGVVLTAFASPEHLGLENGLVTVNATIGVWLAPLPILSTLALPVLGLLEINRRRARLEDSFAALERRDLAWARILLWLNLAVILASGVATALAAQIGLAMSVRVFDLFLVFLAFQLAAILHFAARERASVLTPARPRQAPMKPRLDAAQLNALLDDLALLSKPDLRIRDVAESAGLLVEDLSYALRASLDESFFEYVNRKRIERVQILFKDPARCEATVLELAFEAGFQSKSTFNRVFRAQTGQTPSQWRARLSP